MSKIIHLVLIAALGSVTLSFAQNVPGHAQGLSEELVSVDLSDNKKQVGVYWLHVVSCGKPRAHLEDAGDRGLAGKCLSLDIRR